MSFTRALHHQAIPKDLRVTGRQQKGEGKERTPFDLRPKGGSAKEGTDVSESAFKDYSAKSAFSSGKEEHLKI